MKKIGFEKDFEVNVDLWVAKHIAQLLGEDILVEDLRSKGFGPYYDAHRMYVWWNSGECPEDMQSIVDKASSMSWDSEPDGYTCIVRKS